MPQASQPAGPNIVESYRDFEAPPNFCQTIETLLKYVPAKYLVGLETIVLTNREGLTRDQRRQKVWSRNRKIRLADALGSYSAASKSSQASVWLYVDNICSAESSWWRKFPILRYLRPSEVLYHEIGHHIHKFHRPEHTEREDVAEDWSRKLRGRFIRKHYWYLFPVLYAFARLLSPLVKLAKRNKARTRLLGSRVTGHLPRPLRHLPDYRVNHATDDKVMKRQYPRWMA